MGLTNRSVGRRAADCGRTIEKRAPEDRVVALAGNPNVGKSTVFNGLTGASQHTGNWPGKTVTTAQGYCRSENRGYILVDLPGTYSLTAQSAEEEVARDFLCSGQPDAAVVVCDATCLERNLNLVLQTIETGCPVVVCVNLLDEAARKGIHVDLEKLQVCLGVPVVGTVARKKSGLAAVLETLDAVIDGADFGEPLYVRYAPAVEEAMELAGRALPAGPRPSRRWQSLRRLERGEDAEAGALLAARGFAGEALQDELVSSLMLTARAVYAEAVVCHASGYDASDRRLDRIFTSRATGYPVMLALLGAILWLTISGANYPSQLLSEGLFWLQDQLTALFLAVGAPDWLHGALVLGVYRVLAWVVSVMLPPMMIFFPLFTLLEDMGYLPRVAYNLDQPFRRCSACGKQALTMCMGLGCNAAGVVGCRIIQSPRERLLAILTNSFMPCNGRFPTLIALLGMFFLGGAGGVWESLLSALLLLALLVLSVVLTFAATKLLSATVLKGMSSAFALELPPYRRPLVGQVIVRSMLDRTLFVLGRAAAVAAPAGLLLWIMANVTAGEATLLSHCAAFFDPFARLLGLDGVILLAFLLGFPANEIVVPIMIMAYLAQGSIPALEDLSAIRELLLANGWTWTTAVSVILFSLLHWPCSTTLLTIRKETKSWKWTALAFALPTAFGITLLLLFNTLIKWFA